MQKVCQGPFLISTERLWTLDLTSVQWSKVILAGGGTLQFATSFTPRKKWNKHKKHIHTLTDASFLMVRQNQLRNAEGRESALPASEGLLESFPSRRGSRTAALDSSTSTVHTQCLTPRKRSPFLKKCCGCKFQNWTTLGHRNIFRQKISPPSRSSEKWVVTPIPGGAPKWKTPGVYSQEMGIGGKQGKSLVQV